MSIRATIPLIIPLLVIVLVACAPVTPNLRDDSMMHDRELVAEDPICAAPCWRTITPGITSWNDAIDHLQTLVWSLEENTSGIIAELEVEGVDDSDEITSIATFRPVRSRQVGALCCQMFTRTGEMVDLLIIQVAPSQRLGMNVGAFIEQYGPPDYLVGSIYENDPEQALMNLIYADIPMVVYAYVDGGESGVLRDRNEVIGFMLMTYEEMETILRSNNLHIYEGSGDFSTYSPEEDANFELREGDEIAWSPPSPLLETLSENGFTTMLAVLKRFGLEDKLTGSNQFTIFTPSDEAFENAASELGLSLDDWLADEERLANTLAYHLASGRIGSHYLGTIEAVETALGANINLSVNDPNPPSEEGETNDPALEVLPLEIILNETVMLAPQDFVASNGWVYELDQVLIPPESARKPLADVLSLLNGEN